LGIEGSNPSGLKELILFFTNKIVYYRMKRRKPSENIKVMPDFSSSGLWDENDNGVMIEIEDLDLPPNLVLLFFDWIELFEEGWDRDYSRMDKNKADAMNKRGLELARDLKKIYPNTRVTYCGETFDCHVLPLIVVD
jgi:hypothetical protein